MIIQLNKTVHPLRRRILIEETQKKLVQSHNLKSWSALQVRHVTPESLFAAGAPGSSSYPLNIDVIRLLFNPKAPMRLEGNRAAHEATREEILETILQSPEGDRRVLLEKMYKFCYDREVEL
jgi:hypothetical protein